MQEAAAEMINTADGKGLGAGSGFSMGRGLFDCTAGRLSRLRGSVRQSRLRKGLGKRPKAARGTTFVRGGLRGPAQYWGSDEVWLGLQSSCGDRSAAGKDLSWRRGSGKRRDPKNRGGVSGAEGLSPGTEGTEAATVPAGGAGDERGWAN